MTDSNWRDQYSSVKVDFKRTEPQSETSREADDLKNRLASNKLTPAPKLTIGGSLEKSVHITYQNRIRDKINNIEIKNNYSRKETSLKSKFKERSRSKR